MSLIYRVQVCGGFELESHGPDCESKISAIKVLFKAIPKSIQPEPGLPLELVDIHPYYERNAADPFKYN